jgi:hypothetical protein
MAEDNTQDMFNEKSIVNFTVTESHSFPIFEIEFVSPSLSLCTIPNVHSDGFMDLLNLLGDTMRPGTRFTAELLCGSCQVATFE